MLLSIIEFLGKNLMALSLVGIAATIVFTVFSIVRYWKSKMNPIKYAYLFPFDEVLVHGKLEMKFEVPEAQNIKIEILNSKNVLVKELTSKHYDEGTHSLVIDTTELANGDYFYKFTSQNQINTKKMTVNN